MDEQTRTEIVPLNRELYKDLSIDDLEKRLELGCYIDICSVDEPCVNHCAGQCFGFCGAECSFDGCSTM